MCERGKARRCALVRCLRETAQGRHRSAVVKHAIPGKCITHTKRPGSAHRKQATQDHEKPGQLELPVGLDMKKARGPRNNDNAVGHVRHKKTDGIKPAAMGVQPQ